MHLSRLPSLVAATNWPNLLEQANKETVAGYFAASKGSSCNDTLASGTSPEKLKN